MSDRLLDLQHSVRAHLLAQEFFSDASAAVPVPIPIVTEDRMDIGSEVERAIAVAGGLCVLLRTPGGKIPSADNAAPVYDPAYLHLRVYENPTVNRFAGGCLQPAGKVADAAIRILWTFHDSVPGYNPLVAKGRDFGMEEGIPFYDVVFETALALDSAAPSRAESLLDENGQPIFSEEGENLTVE